MREGDIFYRYPGSADRIKYSDLRAILDERDAAARRDILPLVSKLIELGPRHAFVADLKNGVLEGSESQIVIDPALIDQINFIREGRFSEIDGAPTLRLVGDVKIFDGDHVETRVVRSNVNPDAVLLNFLKNEAVAEPLQYLMHSAHSTREWLPVWYYVSASGCSVEEVVTALRDEPASRPAHRDSVIGRLQGKSTAHKLTPGRPQLLLADFAAGRVDEPGGGKEDSAFALAVQGLPDGQRHLDRIREILLTCFERAQGESSQLRNRRSAIFRAACRLDELLYRPLPTI